MTPPLRFLATVVGGWCLVRAGVLWWPAEEAGMASWRGSPKFEIVARKPQPSLVPVAAAGSTPTVAYPGEGRGPGHGLVMQAAFASYAVSLAPGLRRDAVGALPLARITAEDSASVQTSTTKGPIAPVTAGTAGNHALSPPPALSPAPARRHLAGPSVSSWLLWRSGEGGAGSFGPGTLGGAQAGVRLTLPLAPERLPRVALTARVSSPLRRSGTEAALGIEWQPAADLPVRLLAERRQRVSGQGRSAFALLAHGGVSDRALGGGFDLNAYAAAGVVGAKRRDLFAEGAATVTRALGPVRVGAGAWGGAQPGVERLDVGPTLALPMRLGPVGARVSLDYRVRVAGDAAPGSGPALTLATDF